MMLLDAHTGSTNRAPHRRWSPPDDGPRGAMRAFSWRFFRMGVSRGSRSLMGGVICAVAQLACQSRALPRCVNADDPYLRPTVPVQGLPSA